MRDEPVGLARALHLEDADARPDHVHEPAAAGALLETNARVAALGAVARKQLCQEGVCVGGLGTVVAAPAGGELREAAPDLLPGHGHPVTRLECGLGARHREVGALEQALLSGGELRASLVERLDEMGLGARAAQRRRRALGA